MGWNEVQGETTVSNQSVDYAKLAEGNTIIRAVDNEPFSRWTHWITQAKRSVTCIGKGCPVCNIIAQAKNNKQTPPYSSTMRHTIHIINRNTGKLELLEQGKTFFNQLYDLHKEVGDITTYDIKVIRKGTDKNTTYTLIPFASKPLSEEDLKLIENKINLEEYLQPPTKEQVIDLLEGKDPKEVFSNKSDENDEEVVVAE